MTKLGWRPTVASARTLRWPLLLLLPVAILPARPARAALTENQFVHVNEHFLEVFAPVVAGHGAQLVIVPTWESDNDLAMATRSRDRKTWFIKVWGGSAKWPSATPDAYALTLCHELGHHLGGYPFYSHDPEEWASAEGQADYWSTQACTRMLWANEHDTNELFASMTGTGCEEVFATTEDINLCKRVYTAVSTNADYMGRIAGGRPSIGGRDRSRARELVVTHPAGQCRVDSKHNGLLCPIDFDFKVIPGRRYPDGQNTIGAERAARATSCFAPAGGLPLERPPCWFREATVDKAPPPDSPHAQATETSDLHDVRSNSRPCGLNIEGETR